MSSFLGLEISYLTKINSLMAMFSSPPLSSLLSVENSIVHVRKSLGHQRLQWEEPLTSHSGSRCRSRCAVQVMIFKLLPETAA